MIPIMEDVLTALEIIFKKGMKMSEPKFTPGPWFYECGCITVQSQQGNICDLVTSHNGINMPFEANAALIATAPEMYEDVSTRRN